MVLCKTQITKVLIRLSGCAGWSAPLLFTSPRRQVSRVKAYRNRRKSLPFNETMRNIDKVTCAYATIQRPKQDTVSGHYRPTIETPFEWPASRCYHGVGDISCYLLLDCFCIFTSQSTFLKSCQYGSSWVEPIRSIGLFKDIIQ